MTKVRTIGTDGKKALTRLCNIHLTMIDNYYTIEELEYFINNLQDLKNAIIERKDFNEVEL